MLQLYHEPLAKPWSFNTKQISKKEATETSEGI